MSKLAVFHQPKTGGTYVMYSIPQRFVLPHHINFHLYKSKEDISNTILLGILRNPLDYYISLTTFWCLDPKYCEAIRNNSIEILQNNYDNFKSNNIKVAHPNYIVSNGFTERNISTIINNFLDNEFLIKNSDKLSEKHHTYDYYVFEIMNKLDIGYYTFAFLDTLSSKKLTEFNNSEEVKEELIHIKDSFKLLHQSNLTYELQELCKLLNIPFKDAPKQKVSNRKSIEEYNFEESLIEKIKYKDRYMFDIFKLSLY